VSRSTSNLSKQHYSTTRVERDPAPGAAPVPDALSPDALSADTPTTGSWTFLTNHGHVLLAVHRNPDLRQRDISRLVGITEGAVQRILTELEQGGYIHREKVGRRNHYQIVSDTPLRHPLEQNHTISELLELLEN
jgi:DNA-binding transcriptional ArsR family regulator